MKQHSDDDLRARLARLDPAGALPVEPAGGPRAAQQMERAMQTLDPPPSLDDRRPRRRVLAGAAALAVAAAVVGGVVLAGRDDPAGPPADEPSTLALSLPAGNAMSSCLPFDVQNLAGMSPAFAGTAVEVTDDSVVLDVDRWFTGGDAARVRLDVPGGTTSVALDGVDFEKGERYLITAANGTVNGCGYSGPAAPELERAFEDAFGG